MAMLGGYAKGGEPLPRVVTISISRTERRLPQAGEDLRFALRFREEGTCIAWQRDVVLGRAREADLLHDVAVLDRWTTATGSTSGDAVAAARRVGRTLYQGFVGQRGAAFLRLHPPTALMIDVDETVVSLPWELLCDEEGILAQRIPFGRLVSTRVVPKPERDPSTEDRQLEVLAVVDPTSEMPGIDDELAALRGLADEGAVRLDVLRGDEATGEALRKKVDGRSYDILHFATHGGFDERRPADSGLTLADGPLSTAEVVGLPWERPPYLAFTGACWSGRSGSRRRLVTRGRSANGVAAAFLGAGCAACVCFFWPVSMRGASTFAGTFYSALRDVGGVGEAFRLARERVTHELEPSGDLAGYGAILYGDAATGRRRDLATAS